MRQQEVAHVLSNLRERDRVELAEYGMDADTALAAFMGAPVLARTFTDAGMPAAVIAFHAITPSALAVSLMATTCWPRVARAAFRWGVCTARPGLLARGFRRAECRTLEGHADAISFLEHLGFVREARIPAFGASGAGFIQYAWRISDHVPCKNTAYPAAATGPAP